MLQIQISDHYQMGVKQQIFFSPWLQQQHFKCLLACILYVNMQIVLLHAV